MQIRWMYLNYVPKMSYDEFGWHRIKYLLCME